MKIIQDDLFPTRILLVDNLLEEEYVDSMKKDIIKSSKQKERVNWQSQPKLQFEKKYKALVDKVKIVSEKYMQDMSWQVEEYQITDISGVFYVDAKPNDSESVASSDIQFYDPRPQTRILVPGVNEHKKENSSIWFYPAVINRLLVFPSWLEHHVPINNSNKNRISISWNIMFKGAIGVSEDFQSAVF